MGTSTQGLVIQDGDPDEPRHGRDGLVQRRQPLLPHRRPHGHLRGRIGTYTVAGAADFSVGGDAIDVVFGGTTSQGTTTQGLVIHDGALTNLDMAVTGSFSVGNLSFNADDLTVTYAAASETYTIGGTADFSIGGDAIDVVFGGTTSQGTTTRGLVIQDGALTSLDMAVTGSFSVGSLSFHTDDLTVTYAAASDTYTVAGAADFSVGGDTLDVVFGGETPSGTQTQGLVITDDSLVSLDMTVTGSFTLLGVTLAAQDLTFQYDASQDQYEMSGTLAISTASQAVGSSGTSQVLDGVSATLGQDGGPGLIVSDGTLQSLDVTINGSFSLFGLTVAPNDLQVSYNAGDSVLQVTGGISVTDLFAPRRTCLAAASRSTRPREPWTSTTWCSRSATSASALHDRGFPGQLRPEPAWYVRRRDGGAGVPGRLGRRRHARPGQR